MPTRVITFKADDELIEKIDKLAKMLGESRSNIIRKAVLRYIKDNSILVEDERKPEVVETIILS
ncbi:CopG family transcriptional regulator [Desulfurococcaceae archaeon MEX13E-LK6-19]|nr:CopG family transcriptional regulator [Desulfurococcaceae archaeon MEX13E-LK6-19]